MATKIVFITGTDTGVGKTLLTALLLYRLRASGSRALALKPFCSGGRADAQLLNALQDGDVTLNEINPFYFPEPVAPLISARKHRRRISLNQVTHHIHSIASRASTLSAGVPDRSLIKNSKLRIKNYLFIEGSGGLLVPLGQYYTVCDLISELDCEVIIVARNKLGTINHTLLTVQALRSSPRGASHSPPATRHSSLKVVLMDPATPDASCSTNPAILTELLAPTPVIQMPFLGPRCCSLPTVRKCALVHRRTLARIIR
jgi:dethiobiotin synthetase